jgi:hypothetical protein
MVCPAHVHLTLRQRRRHGAGLEIGLRPQERKVELRDFDTADLVSACRCALSIRFSHGVQKVTARRVWMPLDDRDVLTHVQNMPTGDISALIHRKAGQGSSNFL